MKVEKTIPVFSPVEIKLTIESETELNILLGMFCNSLNRMAKYVNESNGTSYSPDDFVFTGEIYSALDHTNK